MEVHGMSTPFHEMTHEEQVAAVGRGIARIARDPEATRKHLDDLARLNAMLDADIARAEKRKALRTVEGEE